jgi:uncharacterized protein (TIGR02466 family)
MKILKSYNINLKAIPIKIYETDYFLSEKEIFKIKELKIDRQTRFKQKGTLISESMDLLEIKFLKNLKMFLDNIAEDYVKNTLEITNKIKRTQSWATLNNKETAHHNHRHTNCLFNLVYYVKIKSGFLNFHIDKSSIENVFYFDYSVKNYNIYNATTWKLLPKPGNVIIIPGDLMHGVEANYSDEERISIGANYFLTGEVGTDRATKFKL